MNYKLSNRDKSNRLEWLFEKRLLSKGLEDGSYGPYYGDVTELNTNRLILDSVGEKTLRQIAEDAIDLLETSVAIYESNGDYAFGMFSSGWCQLMDTASRKLCHTDDNRIALDGGCWLCHENCWNDSAKAAIESGHSTDIQCVGGINLYAEPIYAGKTVVGTINIGYGTPPKDQKRLKNLADTFDLDIEKLKEQADSYNPRPLFMVDLAKKRLRTSANLIGEMVEKSILQKKLQENETFLESTNRMAKVGGWELDIKTQKVLWTRMTGRIHELPDDFVPTLEEAIKYYHPDDQKTVTDNVSRAIEEGLPYEFEARLITVKGQQRWIRAIGEPMMKGGKCVRLSGTFQDITDRKKTEDALREALLRQKEAIKAGNVGLWDWDLETNKVTYSKEWKLQIGYEDHEIRDDFEEWRSRVHPEDLEPTLEKIQQSIAEGRKDHRVEFRFRHRDGSYRWIMAPASILQIDGRSVRMLGAHIDVTERKEALEKIKESERRLHTIIDQSPFPIAFVDESDESILYLSKSALDTFGHNPSNVAEWYELAHPEPAYREQVIKRWKPFLEKAYKTKKAINTGEYQIACKDGTTKICEIYAQFIPGNLIVTLSDITKRKKAEKSLKENKNKLSYLIDRLIDAIIITDRKGTVKFANRAACELFERKMEDFVGFEFGFPSMLENIFEISTNLVSGKNSYAEVKSAKVVWEGEDAYLLSLRDITERKRAIDERETANRHLQQVEKIESIGNLAGGIAHDFNNMLTVIVGYGEHLFHNLHPSDPLHDYAGEVVKAGRRSAALTRQLLAFSRRQTLQPEVLDLNFIVKNIEKMIRRLIGEDIELTTILDDRLGRVEVDPGQFEQVIVNLAVNARDAMPQGGKLTIETANIEIDEQYADTHISMVPGDYVMLSITDSGCGMAAEIRDKIFEPFFTTKEKGRGTGLGLSTVYGIVKQSGGYIWAYSEPGQGTAFKIYLPRTNAEFSEKKTSTGDEAIMGKGEMVLVVEDEPSLRKLCERLLKLLNYSVTVAANGGEALLLIEEKKLRPDLMITDVIMPEMSGKVLVDRLKENLPDLKILYMSGYTDDAIAHHGILDSGTPFIQKPFAKGKLGKTIRSILDGS